MKIETHFADVQFSPFNAYTCVYIPDNKRTDAQRSPKRDTQLKQIKNMTEGNEERVAAPVDKKKERETRRPTDRVPLQVPQAGSPL